MSYRDDYDDRGGGYGGGGGYRDDYDRRDRGDRDRDRGYGGSGGGYGRDRGSGGRGGRSSALTGLTLLASSFIHVSKIFILAWYIASCIR